MSRFSPPKLNVVSISKADLVRETPFGPEGAPMLMVEAEEEALDLAAWASGCRRELEAKLLRHGALLFRGFQVRSPGDFSAFAQRMSDDLLDYVERAAAREQVLPRIFTSTELACHQRIPLHHEMSYSHQWPGRVFFYCDTPPDEGGRTPVAPERAFLPRLDPAIRRRFEKHGVMYVRNYGAGADLSWQSTFQTEDPLVVERYCRASGIGWQWGDDGRLVTRQVRQATFAHPVTGENVWFNHAHMFHQSNLPGDVRENLVQSLGSGNLPRDAYYGDGSTIEDETLAEIRQLYDDCSISFQWRQGDVLLLDNMLMTHGRDPFAGKRRILVAMADITGEAGIDGKR